MRIRSHLLATSLAVAASGAALASPATAFTMDDLRSPDAIDAADAASTTPSRTEITVTPPPPPPRTLEVSSGFDWGSAAIGAGGAIGLVAVATGAGVTLRRRQTDAPSRLTTQ
jgi:hypothetical protein